MDRGLCGPDFHFYGIPVQSRIGVLSIRAPPGCRGIRENGHWRRWKKQHRRGDPGAGSRHDVDVRSDLYLFVQLDDVRVVHAKTAVRDGAADRAGSIGPVNPVQGFT